MSSQHDGARTGTSSANLNQSVSASTASNVPQPSNPSVSMTGLRRQLKISKCQITTIANKVAKFDEETNVNVLNAFLEDLESEFASFISLHDEGPDADETLSVYSERYRSAKLKLFELGASRTKPPEQHDLAMLINNQQALLERLNIHSERDTTESSSVRLPDLKLPSFNGRITEWPQFFDLFKSTIHENRTIPNVQKFQYLRAALTGEAAAVLASITISDANYTVAFNRLTERYNRPMFLIRTLIHEFLNCKAVSSDLSNLKSVVNCARITIDSLSSQGEYARSRDPWVIALVGEKLDKETNRLWARRTASNDHPSLEEFFRFLDSRCVEPDVEAASRSGVEVRKQSIKVNTSITTNCFCCHGEHNIMKCPKFASQAVVSREQIAKSNGRCFNCLGRGHSVRNCSSRYSCSICKLKHHTLLHSPSKHSQIRETPASTSGNLDSTSSSSGTVQANTSVQARSASILPTAILLLDDALGNSTPIRALLDSGSQANFLSNSVVSRLGIRRTQDRVPISRLGDGKPIYSKGTVNVTLKSRYDSNDSFTIKAHVLPTVIESYPAQNVKIERLVGIRNEFQLADPEFFKRSNVDLILGSSFLFNVLKSNRYISPENQLFLQDTRIGYIVCSKEPDSPETILSNHALVAIEPSLSDQLERFWAIDDIPNSKVSISPSERECEETFRRTTHRLASGRFSVRLPFVTERPTFSNTYNIAKKRFEILEHRLAKNNAFRDSYVKFMRDYESLGHMSRLRCNVALLNSGQHYVIPHHGIFQHGGKLRVVFDASSKDAHGISLNDQLHSGPPLQLHITDILTRFRVGRYAFTCDIAKMYRQIVVNELDRNYQLILWRENPDSALGVYQLNTVTYGQKCSPFLALRVINELASLHLVEYPDISNILLKNRYVDDLLYSDNSRDSIVRARDDLIRVLGLGGFELRKWAANCLELLKPFPLDHLNDQLQIRDIQNVTVPTLGVCWLPSTDSFTYQFTQFECSTFTKRSLVAETARFFDPLGWIAPVVIKLKILIQESWVSHLDWDTPLPMSITNEWTQLRSSFSDLESVRISRHLGAGQLELHGFADASKFAYAAVIYARTVDIDGTVTTRLLLAKTKVAPAKTISIPRLELCAAHLLSKLMPGCADSLNVPLTRVHLWSDSKTVLAWLKSLPRRWTTFVANRVSEIQNYGAAWHYVTSTHNPADIPSRGMLPLHLVSADMWWYGPEFLRVNDPIWNPPPDDDVFTDTDLEQASIKCNVARVVAPDMFEWHSFIIRFSNHTRLLRALAYVFRARTLFRNRESIISPSLSGPEIKFAWFFLIQKLQEHYFGEDLDSIRRKGSCKTSSSLYTLSPFIDNRNILVANTRLLHLDSSIITANPIILPNNYVTHLLIRKTHLDLLHAGPKAVAASIRQTYWIPDLMRQVKRMYRSCVVCSRFNARSFAPVMGPLPAIRLGQTKPFTVTGLDFAGPICAKPHNGRSKTTLKTYIALFVCASTKAVHLELIMSLDVTSLIMGLRRFLARRGHCDTIYSDNGRNFSGCHRAFTEFASTLETLTDDQRTKAFLAQHLIDWRFIPPYSPHFGGLWEAGIRSVKSHLRKGFSQSTLSLEELQTALVQIEGILNSRPLCPMSDVDADLPVTPAHLLIGHSVAGLPEDLRALDASSLTRLRQLEIRGIVSNFWHKWRTDYLPTIMRKPKWISGSEGPSVNDIVIVKRNTDPPGMWALGRVTKLYPGVDGITRVVDVLHSGKIHREAVRHLVPIKVDPSVSTEGAMNEGQN